MKEVVARLVTPPLCAPKPLEMEAVNDGLRPIRRTRPTFETRAIYVGSLLSARGEPHHRQNTLDDMRRLMHTGY